MPEPSFTLTYRQRLDLKRRGFYVKDTTSWGSFIQQITLSVIVLLIILSSTVTISAIFLSHDFILLQIVTQFESIVIVSLYCLGLIYFIWLFSHSRRVFYLKNGIIAYRKIHDRESLTFYERCLHFFSPFFDFELGDLQSDDDYSSSLINKITEGNIILSFIGILMVSLMVYLVTFITHINDFSIQLLCILIFQYMFIFIGMVVGVLIISLFLSFSSSINQYGRLGIKIQTLTKTIEEKSLSIRKQFTEKPNFSVLRNEFGSLASNLEQIRKYVMKLESIDLKLEKGNLFDSGKYIRSLKGDIVKPLTGLHGFLVEHRDALVQSREALVRVRVGGDSSLESQKILHTGLAGETLHELDRNIGKIEHQITQWKAL